MPRAPKPLNVREILGSVTLQQESLLFILVSALDVYMTYILLSQGTVFMESNPVARFFIAEWGPKGMVYFKFSMVAFVCVLAQIISRQKPQYARWLLQGATALVAIVVVYSLMLLLKHGNPEGLEL